MIRKIVLGFLAILILLIIWQYQLIWYGLNQGYGQLKIVYGAEPISEVLRKPDFPDSLKKKLLLIEEIRRYAFDSLGINYSDNYTTFYDLKGQQPLWVITASEPFKLKAYQWKFPFLGNMSYKGHFDKNKAIKEEKELKDKGLDTDLGTVSGWSTLGWFKDPVLSSMLRRGEGRLANLIIHELTHGTLYIKDSVDYNENLASFIGDNGARKYLEDKYGPNSPAITRYDNYFYDDELFSDHILRGSEKLDSVYLTFNSESIAQKLVLKKQMINTIFQSLDTVSFHNFDYDPSYLNADSINNTYFMGFKRYNSKQDIFQRELKEKFNGNLRSYLIYLKEKYPSL